MNLKLALMILLLLGSSIAAAHDRRTSLDDAVSDARERYPGRVLSAETHRRNGNEMHNIRILTPEGRVRRYRIDAESERPRRRPPPPSPGRDFRR